VLEGIDWTITRVRHIFCEFHPYQWLQFGYGPAEIVAFLHDRGFRCFDMYFREQENFLEMGYIGPAILVRR